MASGALPPGLPPVRIDGEFYWDGGLVSNTPLQYVLDEPAPADRMCIFQVDLFSARGSFRETSSMRSSARRKSAIQVVRGSTPI